MNVIFLHPDLGIGGAERLVVDAALALKSKGHHIKILTSHHDSSHCFPETSDGTLDVNVVGSWLPRTFCGRFHAMLAYLRMIYVAFYIVFNLPATDVVFCDVVSVCIPVLKLRKYKIIFYCHYPDLLLTQRTNLLKKLYRFPIDILEEKTTGMADVVIVNSKFTAGVFHQTFKSLNHIRLEVVYPAVKFDVLKKADNFKDEEKLFLSINRYERKKDVGLAIQALSHLKDILPDEEMSKYRLIIAGGYDNRVLENREYFSELQQLASANGVLSQIEFLKSPSDLEKQNLLHRSTAVLYTPQNEHFGIVPLEAMCHYKPVIACNSGGPLETILNEVTGFLCEPMAQAFAEKMKFLATHKLLAEEMGLAGAQRVTEKFSYDAFTIKLNRIVNMLITT